MSVAKQLSYSSGTKGKVFVSHSSSDAAFAMRICRSLESIGLECWLASRDIAPGSEWGSAILDAISNCSAILLIISPKANESQQVLREVERGVSKGKPIIPVRTDDFPLSKSLEYFLSTCHWLNAFDFQEADLIGALSESIERITLGSASAKSPSSEETRLEGGLDLDLPGESRDVEVALIVGPTDVLFHVRKRHAFTRFSIFNVLGFWVLRFIVSNMWFILLNVLMTEFMGRAPSNLVLAGELALCLVYSAVDAGKYSRKRKLVISATEKIMDVVTQLSSVKESELNQLWHNLVSLRRSGVISRTFRPDFESFKNSIIALRLAVLRGCLSCSDFGHHRVEEDFKRTWENCLTLELRERPEVGRAVAEFDRSFVHISSKLRSKMEDDPSFGFGAAFAATLGAEGDVSVCGYGGKLASQIVGVFERKIVSIVSRVKLAHLSQ